METVLCGCLAILALVCLILVPLVYVWPCTFGNHTWHTLDQKYPHECMDEHFQEWTGWYKDKVCLRCGSHVNEIKEYEQEQELKRLTEEKNEALARELVRRK